MTRIILIIIIVAAVVTGNASCNRKIMTFSEEQPVTISRKDDEFNIRYSEGLRLRLMGEGAESLKYFERSLALKPESDAVLFQISQVMLSSGDLRGGISYLRKAYNSNKENKWYSFLLAQLYEQAGSVDSMKYFLERSLELDPGNYEMRIKAAGLYSSEGDFAKAATILESIAGKYGLNERTGMYLVKGFMDLRDYDKAEITAASLVDMFPDEVFFRSLLAEIYAKKDEMDKAHRIFEDLLDDKERDPKIDIWYAEFLIENEELDRLTSALKGTLESTRVPEADKLKLLIEILDKPAIVKDKKEEVIGLIEILELKYPGNQGISMLRPAFYEKTGNYELMVTGLREVIARDKRNYFAWEKLMLHLADNNDWEALYIVAGEGSREFNMSYPAKILFANAALERGDYKTAVAEAGKARIIAGGATEAVAQAKIIEAEALYREGNYAKAFDIFSEILVMDGENITVLNNYAYYLAEKNMELERALEMIEKVIFKEPENKTFLDTYAWVLYKKGKKRRALGIMKGILEDKNVSEPVYYEHTGFILRDLKKCREAIEMWKKALLLGADSSVIGKEIEKCRK